MSEVFTSPQNADIQHKERAGVGLTTKKLCAYCRKELLSQFGGRPKMGGKHLKNQ